MWKNDAYNSYRSTNTADLQSQQWVFLRHVLNVRQALSTNIDDASQPKAADVYISTHDSSNRSAFLNDLRIL
jgi:hypothetical protein